MYIWQQANWPQWHFDLAALAAPLAEVSSAQGRLYGRLTDVGLTLREQATLAALTQDVLKTSEIEGELLQAESVRSSIARRLGVDIGALVPVDRHIEGVVDMVMDATRQYQKTLTAKRLFTWHAALFPTGFSGASLISIAQWRNDASGPMQVVSGTLARQRVHFEAPPASTLNAQVQHFLKWFNRANNDVHPVLRAGLAHLWFVTIHPFDDGNGRIARAVGDMALARAEQSTERFYSLSAQIQRERKDYYAELESAQKGSMDATLWLQWFLGCLLRAIQGAQGTVDTVLVKARFWQRWAGTSLNQRQIKMLNQLLDGFEGKLTSSKWALIAKCSTDTALRDIQELVSLGVLRNMDGGGRSTGYELVL